jgi:serine/threonine protein phosphatase PrpC
LPISNFEPAKHSLKPNGIIKGYSASTNQGPVRDYNEDRVAIILNIPKPEWCTEWKKVAYFGVFDGHGGMNCADFLRDHLHNFVSKEKSFPNDMREALELGF